MYSDDGHVLLLRRSKPFAFWQSVTGSLNAGETHAQAAMRELEEETGFTDDGLLEYTGVSRQFAIDPRWRHRFAPGDAENVEFEWQYRLLQSQDIRLSVAEHSKYCWLPTRDAIDKVWSWTNRAAIRNIRRS